MKLPQFASELSRIFQDKRKMALLTHYNPDGDAMGSSLALSQMLRKMDKDARVIVPNDFPKFLKWMPDAQYVINAEFKNRQAKQFIEEADLIFCLDFNSADRIEKLEKPLSKSKAPKVLIDHHQEPQQFDLMYSDTSQPATCQMVYKVFSAMGWESQIDKDIASCIYTGIITDTGNFKYRNTTSETHEIAAQLMQHKIEIDTINSEIFDNNSLGRLVLLGTVVKRVEVSPAKKTSFLYVTKQELMEVGYQKGDTEGFVNYGLSIEGIEMTVFLSEDIQKDFVKMSFRSKGDVDVSRICREYFNGGGHINAAGGRSDASIHDTIAEIKKILEKDAILNQQLSHA